MTSIAFGGGPSLSQRRSFAALKDGTEVPGYIGYIPQIKYRIGRTYGDHTHELAQERELRHPIGPSMTLSKDGKPELHGPLPKSTGDNKLTEEMVPGYTGYIPRWPFKFGGTYKDDCDVCIDEHLYNLNKYDRKQSVMARAQRESAGPLKPIAKDPQVRDHLNTFNDIRSAKSMMTARRASAEAPIPGYQGYVPKIGPTEIGLGLRYTDASRNGFETFWDDTNYRKKQLSDPVTLDYRPGPAVPRYVPCTSKRLYPQDGMVPKYTGYVPLQRFHFGDTYGNTTRSMDVCSHREDCYGDFMRTKTLIGANRSRSAQPQESY